VCADGLEDRDVLALIVDEPHVDAQITAGRD
jgi:hypothetical protein